MTDRRKLPRELALPRRTLLRGLVGGAAVTLGLPLLDVMLDDGGTRHADGSPLPLRLLTWMWGNGCRLDQWVPAATGPNYTLSTELEPLAAHREKFTVLSGYRNPVAGRRGHHDGMAALFSGYPFIGLDPMGAPYASKFGGRSLDQQAVDWIDPQTMFRSLQVGVTKRHVTNQGPTLETMSHRGPDQPLGMERDPQKMFDKLFGAFTAPGGGGPKPEADPDAALRIAALDAVSRDAKRLHSRVSANDRKRLESHLDSLFTVQKQILAIPPECDLPPPPGKLDYEPDGTEPLAAINAVMARLVAVAFACDLTRVVSFMFTGPSGAQQFAMLPPSAFPEFPGAPDYSHADQHMVSHMNLPYEQLYMHRATVFCMQNLAKLLDELDAVQEGTGTLLDNSCVLAGSDVCEGWSHSENDYPILVAGRAGGRLRANVGHHRSSSGESIIDIGFACLKAVVPNPELVTEYGGDGSGYSGRTTTPCSAIFT
ncbi:MAG: DUF1552 domain-containing protein [Deltaproteobacteria bacterium]|nr:DUF1552 domain-containing protein [Deltaproteobacteria bacterium]